MAHSFIAGEWSPCSVTCGDGSREREVHCKIFLEFSKTIAKLPDKECPGTKPSETEPCFMRPCSLSNKYIYFTHERDSSLRRNLISLFVVDGIRYEPWVGQFSDQSNYKLMLGTRKPVEDLRTATKMELTSGGSGGSSLSVTKPTPSTASMQAHSWKSSGVSQCSASCLGGNGLWLSLSLCTNSPPH